MTCTTNWKDEYNVYLNQAEVVSSYSGNDLNFDEERISKSIKYKNKVWNKVSNRKGASIVKYKRKCNCEWCALGKQHKHLRQQMFMSQDDWYEQDNDPSFWFDEEFYDEIDWLYYER